MTKASGSIIEMSFKLDGLKEHLGSLKDNAYRLAFNDSSFSLFPLFYLANKYVDNNIYDVENETFDLIFSNSRENAEKIKTVVSVLQNGVVWVNIFAFNAFIEASNNMHIDASSVSPYSPSDIAWAMINLAGIEGALTMPIKTEVLGYIKASLDDDGWTMPPLFMMFKNIEDLYEDSKMVEDIKSRFGHLTITDIVNLYDFDDLGIDNRPDLKNYIARNQEYCVDIMSKYNKMMFDWTTAIRGE